MSLLALYTGPATDWLTAEIGWLALVFLIELLVLRATQRRIGAELIATLRPRLFAYLFIAPGTIAHETAHALMCLAMRVRIVRFRPFSPGTLPDGSRTFGFVEWSGGGPLRSTLIALAPLLVVPPLLALLTLLTIGTLDPTAFPAAVSALSVRRIALWAAAMALLGRAAFPSPGDRMNPLAVIALVCAILATLQLAHIGFGPTAPAYLLGLVTIALAPAAFVDAVLLAVLFVLRGR